MKICENFGKKIYFIGIGGISLSALSVILNSYNYIVAGSDITKSELTKKLESLNIEVNYKQTKKNINKFKPNLVVYSSAIGKTNPELVQAKKLNIQCLERADFLEKFTNCFENVISVSGTHGKTTTTSMLAEIFINAGLNPTVHIGGESVNLNGNYFIGSDKLLITEACEYKRSFLKFKTDVSIILNVEEDHPDCYKNYEEIFEAFTTFLHNTKKFSVVLSDLKFDADKKIATFNFQNANFTARKIKKENCGFSFSVFKDNVFIKRFKLNIFGKHNILNALACIAVCDYYNIDKNIIYSSLYNFKGIKRRFEKISSNIISSEIYADYAHHPTEIKKLIEEVKSLNKPIICVFQPHTYTRTKQYFQNFLNSFDDCYQTIYYKTYGAREKPIKNASAKSLYLANKRMGKNVFYYNNFKKVINHLKKYAKSNCVVLLVGAGDIYDIKYLI